MRRSLISIVLISIALTSFSLLSACGRFGANGLKTDPKIDIDNSFYMVDIDHEIEEATMAPEDIYAVYVGGYTIDDCEAREDIDIMMYPDQPATVTFSYEGQVMAKEVPLSDAQVKRIQNVVADYNIEVAKDANAYWPHTEEYPAMEVLFDYSVTAKDKSYRSDGARCTPPGFNLFMRDLTNIITESILEFGGKVNFDVSDENFLGYMNGERYVIGKDENDSVWKTGEDDPDTPLDKYGKRKSWKNLSDLLYTLPEIQCPETADEPCPYTQFDYNTYGVEYDISGKKFLAVCYKNIKTDSGALSIITVGDDGYLYHCFGMPYSAKDTCTIYDNGTIQAHLSEDWELSGDFYFLISADGIVSPASASDVSNELFLIDETSLANYLPGADGATDTDAATGADVAPDNADTSSDADAAADNADMDSVEYPYNFKFVDVFGKEYETEIKKFFPKSPYKAENFTFENGRTYYEDDEYYSRQGIDVSNKQGNIDWEKVKASGIDFVIIREGYRGYGKEGTLLLDKSFKKNIEGAQKAGLDVGVYIFSQAINLEEAIEEADLVLTNLEGYELQLPVVFDPESILDVPARTDDVSGKQFTDNTIVFCEQVNSAGYTPMVYSNMLWEAFEFDMERLSLYGYPFWYADYEQLPQTPYAFDIWQYSCEGRVDGISGPVDLDLQFIKK